MGHGMEYENEILGNNEFNPTKPSHNGTNGRGKEGKIISSEKASSSPDGSRRNDFSSVSPDFSEGKYHPRSKNCGFLLRKEPSFSSVQQADIFQE